MFITLSPIQGGKTGDQHLQHDLNFSQEDYEATHKVTFRNPKPDLLEKLKETGPVPGEGANGARGAAAKKRKTNNVDMDKLADGLQSLGEDDLLYVVQMVSCPVMQGGGAVLTGVRGTSRRRPIRSRRTMSRTARFMWFCIRCQMGSSSRFGTLRRVRRILRLRRT